MAHLRHYCASLITSSPGPQAKVFHSTCQSRTTSRRHQGLTLGPSAYKAAKLWTFPQIFQQNHIRGKAGKQARRFCAIAELTGSPAALTWPPLLTKHSLKGQSRLKQCRHSFSQTADVVVNQTYLAAERGAHILNSPPHKIHFKNPRL